AVALLEGFDIQSMGVAAPFVRQEFGLTKGELAWVFSAATLGMFPGAVLGGRAADRFGRKKVLLINVFLFGVMSLLTAFCTDFTSFVVVRFLTGLGMGAALPLMITIASEAVPAKYNGMAVSVMYSGIPIGAAVTALMASAFDNGAEQWKQIFYLGGIAPIVILPVLMLFLRDSQQFWQAQQTHGQTSKPKFREVLFAGKRAAATWQVWISFFCTLVVLYFILNWLPFLMRENGLQNQEVMYIQLAYQIGAAIGTLILGRLLDKANLKWVVCAIYGGILSGLTALALSSSFAFLALAAAWCGVFLTGGQSALYALAALVYPSQMRGTGVGVAVAAGRIGSFAGPLLAGMILAVSSDSSAVIGASVPVIALAALAALLLVKQLNRLKEQGGEA
ncbi:MAG: 3-(3-hydroxy-phenyl)propionate transporter MhpT, partial [Neisseria sp.]|nr:3-(3-hydroxy-phenyl)propionate transporter MhpT [Neisseria sp.]